MNKQALLKVILFWVWTLLVIAGLFSYGIFIEFLAAHFGNGVALSVMICLPTFVVLSYTLYVGEVAKLSQKKKSK